MQYVILSDSIGNHFLKPIVWKDAYYIASLWKRCRLYLLGGKLISVGISSWSAMPKNWKRFVSRNSSPNRRGAPSRNAVNSTPSDWCYYCRHMALVLIPRHQHALVLIFVPFFLEFADRAMMHDVSENGENICLPSTPVRDEGCLLDYLRSPQNRTSPYSSGSRHHDRVPFSGYESYDRGNIARAPDSVRRNLVGKLSSPELFRGSV